MMLKRLGAFASIGGWAVVTVSKIPIPWRVVDSVTPVRGTVEAHLTSAGIAPLPARS